MRPKTPSQKRANDFDMALFALARNADRNAGVVRTDREMRKWHLLAKALLAIRPDVREMMHPDDRKETM